MRFCLRLCNCAIFLTLGARQITHGGRNLPQAGFGNIAGSYAEGVHRRRCVEAGKWPEV
jgi:hypothetical protein